MSQAAVSPSYEETNRRRFRRFTVAVPVDVVVLRSGIPATIPGRAVDVGRGGVAAVLAGEVWPGEAVGVEFKLPAANEPVQAKAMVRHHGPLRCGLQFLGMPPSQEGSLYSWAQAAANQAGGHTGPHLVWDGSATRPSAEVGQMRHASRPWFLRRSIWLWLAGVVIVASVALGWWRWRQVWAELEQKMSEGTSVRLPAVKVPSSVMERNLLHRVEPIYPDDALRAKQQGLVVLDGVIGSDGAVKELRTVSGSDVLARAAIDAVKWWRFQPYLVNGQPTEVETTIEIDFRLNP